MPKKYVKTPWGPHPVVSIPPTQKGPHGLETWDFKLSRWVPVTAAQKRLLRKDPEWIDPKQWEAAGQTARRRTTGRRTSRSRRTAGRCRRSDGRFRRC
jgi:hypothetical protein